MIKSKDPNQQASQCWMSSSSDAAGLMSLATSVWDANAFVLKVETPNAAVHT